MAGSKIKNTVQTEFVSKGAKKVEGDTQRIGKAQTRLGQSSASAGRSFSAQATGLGGLVAAYAGAAATIFALQQAFSALNAAARSEQTIAGVNALAASIGEQGPKVLARLQEITNGQLSLVQSAELANIALSSGFNIDQIDGLATVGVKAARALGRDLTDSVQRLLRGVAKLEPELLDELGIFTRIEPAAEKYAASIGKVASSLTAFEKRQAFANEAISEGLDKFGDVDSTVETAASSLEKLVATLSDIAREAGVLIANVIQPLVKALGAPVTAIATFGILAKTVFGSAIRELGKSAEDFTVTANSLGDTLTEKIGRRLQGTRRAAAQMTTETQKLNLASTRASIANKEEFNTLIKKARAQEISFGEVKRLNQLSLQEVRINQIKIDQLNALQKRTKAQNIELTRLEARQKSFNRLVTITNTRINSTNKALRLATAGVKGFAVALAFAGRFVAGLLGKITTFITFASIITAVGSAILDAFGFLEPISRFIDDLLRRAAILLDITKEARAQREIRENNPNLGGRSEQSGQDFGAAAVRSIADATGQSFQKVINQIEISRQGLVKVREAADLTGPLSKTKILFVDTSRMEGEMLRKFEARNAVQVNIVQSLQVAAKLQKTLEGGAATLEQIDKRRGAVLTKILNLKLSEDERDKKTADNLQKELDILNFQVQQQVAILNTRKKLRNEFSAQIKAADNLNKFFILDNELNLDSLKVATSQRDIERSRTAQLQKNFELGSRALERQRAGAKDLTPIQKQLAMLARDAEKALIGTFIKSFEAARDLDLTLGKILDKETKRLQIAQQQIKITQAQNAIASVDQQTKELTNQIKRTDDLARANEKLRVARLKSVDLVRESERKLTEELIKMNPFLSEGDKRDLTLKLERESLKRLEESIKEQKKALIENQKAEQKILEAQIAQQQELISTGEFTGLIEKRIQAEKKLQLDKIDADEKAALKELTTLEKRNKLLIQELKNFETHINGIAQVLANDIVERKILANEARRLPGESDESLARRSFTQELVKAIQAGGAQGAVARGAVERFGGIVGPRGGVSFSSSNFGTVEEFRKVLLDIEKSKVAIQVSDQLKKLKDDLDAKDFATIRKAITDVANANRKLAENRSDAKLISELAAANEKLKDLQNKLKISGIDLSTGLTDLNNSLVGSTNNVSNLADVTKKANDTFSNGIREVGNVLRGQFAAGLTELNDALINGTLNAKNFKEGLTDFLGETVKKVQQAFFQETIAKPVSNFLTSEIGNLLGVDMSGGIEDLKLESGNVPVVEKGGKGIVNSFANDAQASLDGANKKTETLGSKFSSFLDELVEKGRSSFSSIGSFLTDVLAKIGNSMGAKTGGLFDSILSGAGNLFGGGPGAGMSAVTPFTTLSGVGVGASGGVVPFSAYQRLAAGGMARDRVPALLEPGEFVLKRSAARNIGNSNLQAMNAGGMPNIKVQVKNEGTPQEATTATPRMDVDAIVIDIVTRDLRNNGPIRKSMRGGA